jgi:hypothetical protein
MSKLFCILIKVSISGPNAFSIRIAISAESDARSFSRADRAGRVTPNAFAAAVTERPRGSKITDLTNTPG